MAIAGEYKMSEKNIPNSEFKILPPSETGLAFSTSEESPSTRDIINYKVTQLAPEKSQETPR